MPLDQVITDLPDFKILKITGKNLIKLEVIYQGPISCPHCQSQSLRSKAKFMRKVRHISIGDRLTELHIHARKYLCKNCGKYFNQRFPGIMPYKRASEPFRKEVFQNHHDGITQRQLAKRLQIGCATIERWYQDFVKLEIRKFENAHAPRVLGIDEHFFTKKSGYATTFANLAKNKVHDVALGRSQKALLPYLRKMPKRENTRVIVMDLSETYRSIAKNYFPNAMIVADRFHVIRLVNHHFLATWKQIDPEGRKSRGLLSLMRRHEYNLKGDQKEKLCGYFQKHPALAPIYEFKQELCLLLNKKHQKRWECKQHVKRFIWMIEELKNSPFASLQVLGISLDSWKEEIARMWRFTKTNSITEGLHNKMEMISRRAFGFRNFENYRMRVKVHCGYQV